MSEISLPILNGDEVSVHDALAEVIDRSKSALLYPPGGNKLRIVEFEDLEKAAAGSVRFLKEVPSQSLEQLGFTVLQTEADRAVLTYGPPGANTARRYNSPSLGFHCDRPNKPPNTPDRQWYHYYPPNRRDPNNPKRCRVCGSPLP
jgi:hypothetical protein